MTRGPGPSLCLSLSWEPTVTTAVLACPEVDDRSFVSAVNTPYLHKWIPAKQLKKGEHLKTADGTLAVADGGTTPKVHAGWMWDLTVPGNNDHDFYVITGTAGVLVHNENYDPCTAAAAFQDLRNMRAADKIPQIDEMGGDEFARARLDLYGERFYGRNAPSVTYPQLDGTTYQTWIHAEGDAFGKAIAAEMPRGGDAVLYVDQDPCPFCENSFAGLARSLGLNSLQVATPQGSMAPTISTWIGSSHLR